eukprot:gene4271-6050_t
MFTKASSKKKSTSKSESKYDDSAAQELYLTLCNVEDDPDRIDMEGIGKLCEMLSIDPATDVTVLSLMWKLGATSKPGSISQTEFLNGLKQFRVYDINGIKSILPSLDPGFLDKNEFRDFYRFVFQFSREGTHKTIEKEIVLGLLPIILDSNRAPHLELFLNFLQQAQQHQRITLDQWDSFLQFQHVVKLDLSNLEEDGAWPLLLDEYVEWRRAASKK